ncbi:4-hydroxy-tetrahydrodipicolinate reductase [Chrysiogenes arsenatis]|uniref:4-hydroxy-tetrahydrodipicolinate reductase n=1 Tax=Chrysiogenes arsenatis TaxID=309797 RepID=UPI000414C3BB|nr:4-hydroxy-tetrahydrodipicolinate reductase [Chrysiogenes arsenatis]
MTRIAVIGAVGRMGRYIMNIIESSDTCTLAGAIDAPNSPFLGLDSGEVAGFGRNGIIITDDISLVMEEADVAIDFTVADAVPVTLAHVVKSGKGLVIGTTGLNPAQKALVGEAATKIPIVYAPNMSTGVNVTWKLLEVAAGILGNDVDVEIVEAHHNKKKDAPSGTAMKMAEVLARVLDRDLTTDAVYHREGMIGERTKNEIGIQTIRGGDIVGEHTVYFCGHGERIEITHRAHTRETFASGAVKAAQWLTRQPAGQYDMFDVLGMR